MLHFANFALEMCFPEQPDIWVEVPEPKEDRNIRMSKFGAEMHFAVVKRDMDPDSWYSCSRGARVVMLAVDRLVSRLAHAYKLLHPDED